MSDNANNKARAILIENTASSKKAFKILPEVQEIKISTGSSRISLLKAHVHTDKGNYKIIKRLRRCNFEFGNLFRKF
ncbi:hypothetical protein AYI68_g4480 [Smittium mucronatum]|uniref:Uncharacterized protein n=1 Tax=Smittium mucronatum TaxID=133383 RepID=A0A1R0GWZ1_9FUNG|nr:hypothetical protein AYI68_g4480 [Smittium mucronatum]